MATQPSIPKYVRPSVQSPRVHVTCSPKLHLRRRQPPRATTPMTSIRYPKDNIFRSKSKAKVKSAGEFSLTTVFGTFSRVLDDVAIMRNSRWKAHDFLVKLNGFDMDAETRAQLREIIRVTGETQEVKVEKHMEEMWDMCQSFLNMYEEWKMQKKDEATNVNAGGRSYSKIDNDKAENMTQYWMYKSKVADMKVSELEGDIEALKEKYEDLQERAAKVGFETEPKRPAEDESSPKRRMSRRGSLSSVGRMNKFKAAHAFVSGVQRANSENHGERPLDSHGKKAAKHSRRLSLEERMDHLKHLVEGKVKVKGSMQEELDKEKEKLLAGQLLEDMPTLEDIEREHEHLQRMLYEAFHEVLYHDVIYADSMKETALRKLQPEMAGVGAEAITPPSSDEEVDEDEDKG